MCVRSDLDAHACVRRPNKHTLRSCYISRRPAPPVQTLAQHFGVRAMPTFVIVKDGEKVDELVGASKDKLVAMIAKAVA
jgi:thiol-disulfide isomerase/thioredoxin